MQQCAEATRQSTVSIIAGWGPLKRRDILRELQAGVPHPEIGCEEPVSSVNPSAMGIASGMCDPVLISVNPSLISTRA
jgi:hypothetical protein